MRKCRLYFKGKNSEDWRSMDAIEVSSSLDNEVHVDISKMSFSLDFRAMCNPVTIDITKFQKKDR